MRQWLRNRPLARAVVQRGRALRRLMWPRWLAYLNLRLRSRTANTFNERLTQRMAYDRDSRFPVLADKQAVRSMIADIGLNVLLTECYGVMRRGGSIPWMELPREYVMKATHGSGAVLLVSESGGDELPGDPRLFGWEHRAVHPDLVTESILQKIADHWLTLNFEYSPLKPPEWFYGQIEPGVIFEEFITGGDGKAPNDFKFFMFGGCCHLIQVDSSRFGNHARDFFSPEWQWMDLRMTYPNAAETPPRPARLDEMLSAAEKLSLGLSFVRIDLYETRDRVVFGEITLTPGNGTEQFEPTDFDKILGTQWP